MPTIKIKATELIGTEVDRVSLVKRAANRIPFRFTKGEASMLDLGKISRVLSKKEDPKPAVVAAVVLKGADLPALAKVFKDAGLEPKSFVQKADSDGFQLVKKGATVDDNAIVLLSKGDVALVVSDLKKGFSAWNLDGDDFNDQMRAQGFFPSLCTAGDIVSSVIQNVLYDAATPADAASQISQICDDFKNYVIGLAGSLPVQAFKADVALAKAVAGIGPGFEAGAGTETSAAATEDDLENTAVGAVGAETTTGNPNSGPLSVRTTKASTSDDGDDDMDDPADDVNGDTADDGDDDAPAGASNNATPAKGKAASKGKSKKKSAQPGMPDPTGFVPGDDTGFAADPDDTKRAVAAGNADMASMAQQGGSLGSIVPDGDAGITVHKNNGDADIGKATPDQTLPDSQSGSGAQNSAEVVPTAADLTKSGDSILAAIAALGADLKGQITAVKNDLNAVNNRVDQVATMAKKTDAALNGTVFSDESDDAVRTQKADRAKPLPLLDTAYNRRSAA